MALQARHHVPELDENLGKGLLHGGCPVAHFLAGRAGQGLGCTDTRHHVLALGVDQELAVQTILAGGRIARKGHPGCRGVPHVAEHHGLDIDCRAPALGDVVHAAIELGPLIHPAGEDGTNGAPELGLGILREGLAQLLLDRGLVVGHDLFPVLGGQGGIDGDVEAILVVIEDFLEQMVIQAKHHSGVHLDEAPVGIQGEAAVSGQGGQPLRGGIVQPKVQDRVHHAGHGSPSAGPDRDQEGGGRVAKPLSGQGFDTGQRRLDLRRQDVGIRTLVRVEEVAGLGGDGEAGRHRQPQCGHLG